jgi:Na+/H+ antiporter NhaC
VVGALTILWVAWALSGLTTADHLGTGEYLGGLLQSALDVRFLPTAVFILASLIAFATGTSWGTMGILMPLVIAVVYRMLADTEVTVTPENTIMVAAIGSVLAGAIFGDHCSPISDTTVLSSQSSGCDHIAHVRTQLPYAMVVGTVSIVFGTLPIGFGVSVWILLPLCLAALALFLVTVGRRAEVE